MDHRDISAVKASVRLSELIGGIVKLRRQGSYHRGLCYFHKERTPSFWVHDESGTFGCFGCSQTGDAIDWLMLRDGLEFGGALNTLIAYTGGTPPSYGDHGTKFWQKQVRPHDDERRIAHAHTIWLKREPVAGTLAQTYLRKTRGLTGAIPDILGYVPRAYCSALGGGEETEALVAPLQDSHGHVTAVQQIFLCRETQDAWRDERGRRVKRTLGAMRDGCVRLGLPDTTLGLAGSVEDALAASSLYSLPVWATCGEQRLSKVWVPETVDQVIIFADADDAGWRAAEDARKAHRAAGKTVDIITPEAMKDFTAVAEKRAEVWA
jgi:DNA primase